MNLSDDIARTGTRLILKEPFYGQFLSGILKEISSDIPASGLFPGKQNQLSIKINPEFWAQIESDDLKFGIFKHELLHAALGHMFLLKSFGNKDIFFIACDLVVNQYLEIEQIPAGALTLEIFSDLNLKKEQSVKYYYEKLIHLLEEKNPQPSPSLQALQKTLSGENIFLKQHEGWTDFAEMPRGSRQILERSIEDVLYEIQKKVTQWGNLPGEFLEKLKEIENRNRPMIHWKRILRLFAQSSRRTRIKNTIQRPSKRYGTTPGLKIQRKQKILVALDTSGSVSQKELNVFFSEIYHMHRNGDEIFIVECDTEISKSYYYRGQTPRSISGRGGTAFDAPIRYANEVYLPDCLIYFTDGYGNSPEISPRKPVLWVITSDGIGPKKWEFLPGRKVKLQST